MSPQHHNPSRPQEISPVDAYARSRAGEAVLLDVREEEAHAAAPDAVLLPLRLLAMNAPLSPGIGERPVLCVCQSGRRSRQAAGILTTRGARAWKVPGGMQAWAQADLPVRTGPGQVT